MPLVGGASIRTPTLKWIRLVACVAADDRCGVVALVAKYSRGFDLEDARTFLGHGGEDSLGARLGGDEGGDAPQRALLLCEPADLRELRLRIALEGAFVVDTRIARAELDAGGDENRRRWVLTDHEPVRPGDQLALAVLRHPVPDLRARQPRLPHVGEHLAERLRFLGRDDELARVAADDFVAREPGQAFAGIVEEQDPAVLAQHADERHRRLGEDPRELVAEDEVRSLRHRRA